MLLFELWEVLKFHLPLVCTAGIELRANRITGDSLMNYSPSNKKTLN